MAALAAKQTGEKLFEKWSQTGALHLQGAMHRGYRGRAQVYRTLRV